MREVAGYGLLHLDVADLRRGILYTTLNTPYMADTERCILVIDAPYKSSVRHWVTLADFLKTNIVAVYRTCVI